MQHGHDRAGDDSQATLSRSEPTEHLSGVYTSLSSCSCPTLSKSTFTDLSFSPKTAGDIRIHNFTTTGSCVEAGGTNP